jgi:hypothetical protein
VWSGERELILGLTDSFSVYRPYALCVIVKGYKKSELLTQLNTGFRLFLCLKISQKSLKTASLPVF